MARALTKGKTIGVQLPLALDAEIRDEAAASGTTIGRFVTAIVIAHYRGDCDGRRSAPEAEDPGVGVVALASGSSGAGSEDLRSTRSVGRAVGRGVAALRAECRHPAFVARHGIVVCAYCQAPRQ